MSISVARIWQQILLGMESLLIFNDRVIIFQYMHNAQGVTVNMVNERHNIK